MSLAGTVEAGVDVAPIIAFGFHVSVTKQGVNLHTKSVVYEDGRHEAWSLFGELTLDETMLTSVLSIVLVRAPRKVGVVVVSLDTVLMVDLRKTVWVRDKRLCDKTMNTARISLATHRKAASWVATLIWNRLNDLPSVDSSKAIERVDATEATMTRYLIASVKLFNGLP